jgi:thymidine phosphorylase
MSALSAAVLIRKKRDGGRLDRSQLRAIANGIGNGEWSEGQIAAFAMTIAWRGMRADECREFTLALRDSGHQLDWTDLPGPVLDKHSTGGVGDCVSLLLAPLVAACGGFVPMISGRGLGHTGGTLDKLESLPGYEVHPSLDRLKRVVRQVGCAIVGQSADLVPADRRLYAVRDVTATVDVPELIVASILSKKLAGGAAALVLDVKTGSGALLPDLPAARALSERMLAVAEGSGLRLRVALSDMGQVLGSAAGNALEVRAILDLLCGRCAGDRLLALSLALAGELLQLGGLAADPAHAERRLRAALASGAAAESFQHMVAELGGPADLLDRPDHYLACAPIQRAVLANEDGYVTAIDVRALGASVVQLGGGRSRPGQALDYAVGLAQVSSRGERVVRGMPLAIVHARCLADADTAAAAVLGAFTLGGVPPPAVPLLTWFASTEVHA